MSPEFGVAGVAVVGHKLAFVARAGVENDQETADIAFPAASLALTVAV